MDGGCSRENFARWSGLNTQMLQSRKLVECVVKKFPALEYCFSWTILLSVRGFVGSLMEVRSCLFDSRPDEPF